MFHVSRYVFILFFFFQAEDGIRDYKVTGVQTCALPISVMVTTVTATFTLQSFALTVTRAGTGTGAVTSNAAGITCGATCSAPFDYNTAVTLTAAPATGSTFTGWSGGGGAGGWPSRRSVTGGDG